MICSSLFRRQQDADEINRLIIYGIEIYRRLQSCKERMKTIQVL